MANSLKTSTAVALQAYVRDYAQELFTKMFYRFKTAELVSVEEGVKGQRILTNLKVGTGLSKRYSSTFAGKADAAEFVPRTLTTVLNKAEFSFTPTELENSYLGWLRKSGQDPMDNPFEAYVMEKFTNALKMEMENAVWQGVAAGSPASTDLLAATFNGFKKIIADEITDMNITPITTTAITSTNAVAKFRLLWAGVDPAYQESGTAIICSMPVYDAYRINYKDLYHQAPTTAPIAGTNYEGMDYELGGGNTKIVCVPGLGSSGRVIVTPLENLVIGLDGAQDINWNVEQDHWNMDVFAAFRLGVQIRSIEAGVLVVNEQV